MPRAGLDAAAVVAAAAALADADGLAQLTLARLAAALGIRTPSLYAHVDGLSDLRVRLGARGARELAASIQIAAAGRARGEALRAVALAYREYAHAHPGTYAAMQVASGSEEFQAAGAEVIGPILAVLARLRAGGGAGDPRGPGDPQRASRLRLTRARGWLRHPGGRRRQLRQADHDARRRAGRRRPDREHRTRIRLNVALT